MEADRLGPMSYEVLARKLRPSGFAALVGQDHVVRALSHALDHGRLHHAYLFTGTRGVGKTTIARILAKSLNCEQGVSSTPCGQCSICLEVAENRFMDLIEVDAASRTGVDDTRDLLENAQYMPSRGRFKVYLIDEVHMLSVASFNALLKTLEEPPEHVKFLLATTDPKKVPMTVLSRCLQFQLKNISAQLISDYLAKVLSEEAVDFEPSATEVIAKTAQGSMRDALSLTDQAISYGQGALKADDVINMLGLVGRDEVGALLEALAKGEASGLMQLTAELAERSADFASVLKGLIEALHELTVAAALGKAEANFSAEELQLYYQIALIGLRDLSIVPDARSGFEMTLLRMLAFSPERDSGVPSRGRRSAAPERAEDPSADTAPDSTGQEQVSNQVAEQAVPSPEVTHEPAAPSESVDRWADLVEALPIGGVTKMIADHATPTLFTDDEIVITLSRQYDTLFSEAQAKNLERAVAEHLGRAITFRVEVGDIQTTTPAERRQRLADERQRSAEEALETDSTLQGVLSDFDGKLDAVRPT